MHVIEGEVVASIDSAVNNAQETDTLAVPTHATVSLANRSGTTAAYHFVIDDAPLRRWASSPKFRQLPNELTLVRQALGVRSEFGLLSTAGSA